MGVGVESERSVLNMLSLRCLLGRYPRQVWSVR